MALRNVNSITIVMLADYYLKCHLTFMNLQAALLYIHIIEIHCKQHVPEFITRFILKILSDWKFNDCYSFHIISLK